MNIFSEVSEIYNVCSKEIAAISQIKFNPVEKLLFLEINPGNHLSTYNCKLIIHSCLYSLSMSHHVIIVPTHTLLATYTSFTINNVPEASLTELRHS